MKTLVELRTEIELGMTVYPTTNHDVYVWREEANEFHEVTVQRQSEHPWYKLYRSQQTPLEVECTDEEKKMQGRSDIEHAYSSFDALLADWPFLASQPVWSTIKTVDRLRYEKQVKDQWNGRLCKWCASELINDERGICERCASHSKSQQDVHDENEDDSFVPLDSQLGQDVAQLVGQYFPEIGVASIQSSYYGGVFIDDFSINMEVSLDHPIIQRVGISFTNEDIPGRPPKTWKGLLALPGIRLFLCSVTLQNSLMLQNAETSRKSITLKSPRMYQEEIEAWCDTHDDGMLYSHVETPEMFIIATELMSHSHEEIERAAQQLVEQAHAKVKEEPRGGEDDDFCDLKGDDLGDLSDRPF